MYDNSSPPRGFLNGVTDKPKTDKKSLGTWKISTYYTPVQGQKKYFNGSYARDYYVNCSGDCFKPASGITLADDMAGKIVACPSNFKLGTKFWTEKHGILICEDRGGAIKGKRLDLYVGVGDAGYNRIGQGSGYFEVFQIL